MFKDLSWGEGSVDVGEAVVRKRRQVYNYHPQLLTFWKLAAMKLATSTVERMHIKSSHITRHMMSCHIVEKIDGKEREMYWRLPAYSRWKC